MNIIFFQSQTYNTTVFGSGCDRNFVCHCRISKWRQAVGALGYYTVDASFTAQCLEKSPFVPPTRGEAPGRLQRGGYVE